MQRLTLRLLLMTIVATSLLSGRTLVAQVSGGEYIVQPGDTLDGISRKRGVPVEQILSLNSLPNPDALSVGQMLRLPETPSSGATQAAVAPPDAPTGQGRAAAPAPGGEYVVRAGDTVSGIARSLGVTVRALVELNEISDPNRLVVGQRLSIPEGARRAESSPVPPSPSSDGSAALLERLARQYGVDPALAFALAWPNGSRPSAVDRLTALGLLQVAATTFEHVQNAIVRRSLDRSRVEDVAEAGIAYFGSLLRWAGDGGEALALAAYIQGPGSVKANGVQPETERQVKAILATRDRFRQGGGSAAAQAPPTSSPTEALVARVVAATRAIAGSGARIGVAGHNLTSGQRLSISAEELFPAASVAKLAIMVEAYRQSEQAQRPITEAVFADLRRMIGVSDNEAANRLMDLFGLQRINQTIAGLGLSRTRLGHHFETVGSATTATNQTTPSDMARLLELLATDRLVSQAASRDMRALLTEVTDDSKLRNGLPRGASLAHKSGWYTNVANDVGIVTQGTNRYVLAVFTEGIAEGETANQTIAAVARVVHGAWAR